MPSTIPYDPSLVLGNLVSQESLDNLLAISALQAPIDAAEDTMNSYISMKRSIDMTIQELIDMEIDISDLAKESTDIGKAIQDSAVAFAKAKLDGLTKIQPLKAKISGIHDALESPVDFNKSDFTKIFPISSDSLKLNVQYFHFDQNTQDANTQASTVKRFISGELDRLGTSIKGEASRDVQSQMNSQYQNHSISGTLVISITCTHKGAKIIAPLIIDVDKAIRIWNKVYKDDMIKTNDPGSIASIIAKSETKEEKALTVLSGASYGSCFIGMVHILDTTSTTSNETASSMADSMQAQFKIGNAFASLSGNFGMDSSFSNDIKNLLSTQNVTSHCTLVTVGAIPVMSSSTLSMAVKQFSQFDGDSAMKSLAQLQNATAEDINTLESQGRVARTGKQLIEMQNSKIAPVLAAIQDATVQQNKVLDTNSMMNAMDNYVAKALSGDSENIGVPINYYLKPITKSQLAEMWIAKYYPGQYMDMAGDDSAPTSNQSAQGQGDTSGGK